jgi:clathrin heavy chain
MEANKKLLITREAFNLGNVKGGLRPGAISFKNVTLQTDKFCCVRDVQADGSASLAIVDLEQYDSIRNDIKDAEAPIMSSNKCLALRSGTTLQVFQLNPRQKLKEAVVNDPISYWKWINDQTIAIVTTTQVLHWSLTNDAGPTRVFDRELDSSYQILNYTIDEGHTWCMLNGISRTAEGQLVGKSQLYSVENGGSRVLDGHTGCFASIPTPKDPRPSNVMCLAWTDNNQGRLLMMELPTTQKRDATFERRNISLDITNPGDFPVLAHISRKHHILTVATSRGQAVLVDVHTGLVIASEQVSQNVIFTGTPYTKTDGVLCVNNGGSVFQISINDAVIAKHIQQNLNNPEVALRVASTANLSGVDDLFRAQFQNLWTQQDYTAAIDVCLAAPNDILRSREVLTRFQALTVQPPPISAYFKAALAKGKLNGVESAELAKIVLAKGGMAYVKQQYDEQKLTVTEDLGDVVAQHDGDLAMKMYHSVNAHHKVVNVLLARNETHKAVEYCRRANYSPDWRLVLNNFVRAKPDDAVNLALMLHNDMGDKPLIDPLEVVDMFLPGQNIRQASEFLVKILKDRNTPETAPLQTRLLEINLKHSPASVAQRILDGNFCSFYDPNIIAPLLERAALYQYALDAYNKMQIQSDYSVNRLADMKRCLAHAPEMNPQWLIDFFGRLRQSDSLECIGELMGNRKANFKLIVQIAIKYNDALGTQTLIDMFIEPKAYDILYYYLGPIVPYSRDPEVHFRYIEASTEVGQINEVERMTKESPCYEPQRTKNYLKEKHLENLWPLINVCDKYDYIDELIKYLIDSGKQSFIEQYVQRYSPTKTPLVVAALLEMDSPEPMIQGVLDAAGSMCPIDELVEQVESRGRLRVLRKFLEARANERRTDAAIYNALAKIYIDSGENVEHFLKNNEHYSPDVVGGYLETRDPNMAFLAYRRGGSNERIVAVGIKNGMWKPLGRYLVEQMDLDLWHSVLEDTSFDKKQLVEAVRHDALAHTASPDEVIATVRAFMQANMTEELTTILDQVVLHGQFQKNKYLENLLLISAIKSRPEKVAEYVGRLQHYDPLEIGPMAVNAGLFESAFHVFEKAQMKKEAVSVLLDNLNDLSRARAYAVEVKDPAVWTVLGVYLLKKDDLHEAIEALITAKNPNFVQEVVDAADRVNQFSDLVKYLMMARKEAKVKDPQIDTYLVLTYAKTGRLGDLEEFLKNTTHSVKVNVVADKCFADGLYDSARVLYTAASNWQKLASTLIRLKNYPAAVEAAVRAQNAKTWREVMVACLDAEEIPLANQCAAAIAGVSEELPRVVELYEGAGLFEELITVLKSAMGTAQGANMTLFTELGIQYAKHKPEKLLEHIKMHTKKINMHKMITACQQYHHWLALRHLHIMNEDWLSAAHAMMEHPVDAWEHEIFKDVLGKLGTSDLCYTAISFYVMTQPTLLHDLLMTLGAKIDATRVMLEVKKYAPVSTIRTYLEAVQDKNNRKVNDTLNGLYVEEEDFAALRSSVDRYNNFDSAELSAQLEKMELFEFRRIALLLHRRNKRYFHAIEVAKANELYSDAIEAAAESGDADLASKLLQFFCEQKRSDCFAACLYLCYDLVPQHVALELSWLHGMTDAAMPFLIQAAQDLNERVAHLEKTVSEAKKQVQEARAATAPAAPLMISGGAPGQF